MTDLEEKRARLKASLDKDPELKAAFIASVKEMQKPENRKQIVDQTVRVIQAVQAIQRKEN